MISARAGNVAEKPSVFADFRPITVTFRATLLRRHPAFLSEVGFDRVLVGDGTLHAARELDVLQLAALSEKPAAALPAPVHRRDDAAHRLTIPLGLARGGVLAGADEDRQRLGRAQRIATDE